MKTYKIVESKSGFGCYKRKWFFFWDPVICYRGHPDIFYFRTFDAAFKNLCEQEGIMKDQRIRVKFKLLTQKK